MTAPYDHEALWLKAKMFLNRAMDEHEVRSFDERALWATLALELLAKAALARTSPVLIAEPTEEGTNLLIATGLLEGDAQFISVRAKTVFSRCQRAFRPFGADEEMKLTSARNEYLHGAMAGFTSIPEPAWWPLFWRQAIILNNAVERDIAELVGPTENQSSRATSNKIGGTSSTARRCLSSRPGRDLRSTGQERCPRELRRSGHPEPTCPLAWSAGKFAPALRVANWA